MLKTASALLAAVALAFCLGALALGPASPAGLAFIAAAIYAGWVASASLPLRREWSAAIAFTLGRLHP